MAYGTTIDIEDDLLFETADATELNAPAQPLGSRGPEANYRPIEAATFRAAAE